MSVAGLLRAVINLEHKAAVEITSPSETVIDGTSYLSWDVTDGTGANQADMVFADQRTLGNGASEELDLYGGLTDSFGVTQNFARIKGFYIKAASTNTDTITIGNAAANGWPGFFGALTHTVVFLPGAGIFAISPDAIGWPVTNATADKLKILNDAAGAAAIYDIVLIGASA